MKEYWCVSDNQNEIRVNRKNNYALCSDLKTLNNTLQVQFNLRSHSIYYLKTNMQTNYNPTHTFS